MGRRTYSRRTNGRFRRATLENTFGLTAPACPSCRRLNPHGVNEPVPENCHACGAPMNPDQTPEPEAEFRWNNHYRDDGVWCRWSLCSVSRERAAGDDHRCPVDCPDSAIEVIPAPESR
jgi:hypothetical protein